MNSRNDFTALNYYFKFQFARKALSLEKSGEIIQHIIDRKEMA